MVFIFFFIQNSALLFKYNQEKSTRILIKKEYYEYHSNILAELKYLNMFLLILNMYILVQIEYQHFFINFLFYSY